MAARPAPDRALRLFTGAGVQGDSVAAAAGFLLDAARGDVSTRTVVQVLRYWVDDGMSSEQVRHALAVADESCPLRHRPALNEFRHAIAAYFSLPGEI